MRMAMGLQGTFDALVPYFVYRTVLEQGLEEARQEVADAQSKVRASRRAYNRAMDDLEAISMEIQAAQAEARRQIEEGRSSEIEERRSSEIEEEDGGQEEEVEAVEAAAEEEAAAAPALAEPEGRRGAEADLD